MQVSNYNEYMYMRDELFSRGRREILESADVQSAVAKLDSDNRNYFSEYVDDAKAALLSLSLSGIIDEDVMESGINRIDEYAQEILDIPTDSEVEYTEMMNVVENIKLGLYTECQNGNISVEERERGLARITEIAQSCSNIDDLEESLPGVVSEGFVDATKSIVGKITPFLITITFKGKVMNLKLVTKAGIDAKKVKEKFNGIECENPKAIKNDLAKQIKKTAEIVYKNAIDKDAALAAKARQYSKKSPEDLYKDLRPKYVQGNGASIELICAHKFLAKDSIISIKFDSKGDYHGLKLITATKNTTESVADDIFNDILETATLDLSSDDLGI